MLNELEEYDPDTPVVIGVEFRNDAGKFIGLDWHNISVIQEGDVMLNGMDAISIYAGEQIV